MNEKMTVAEFGAAFASESKLSQEAGLAFAREVYQNPNIRNPQTHQYACYLTAISNFYEARFEEAEKLLKSYAFSYQRYPFITLYIDTFDLLGIIQFQKKRYHLAIFYEEQAISLAKEKKALNRLASLYNNEAGAYHSIKDDQKCLNNLDAAISYLDKTDEATMDARIVFNRAQVLLNLGRSQEALTEIEKATVLVKKNPMPLVNMDELPLVQEEIKLALHGEVNLHAVTTAFLASPSQKDKGGYVFLLEDDEDLCDLLLKNGLMEDAKIVLAKIEEIEAETPSLRTEIYLAKTKAALAKQEGRLDDENQQLATLNGLYERQGEELDRDFEEVTKLYLNFVSVTSAYQKAKKRARKLLVESSTDTLTGLPNRRALEKEKKYLPAFSRKAPYFALALLDYDHFKEINDGYGYQSGDSALHLGGALFKGFAGPLTKIFRYGGDEFLFAIAISSPEEAASFFERIKHGLEAIDLTGPEGQKIPLSCCIGYGLFKGTYASFSSALKAATEAIHAAKHIGRGNVVSVTI
jgi:diguanylate cyclase (GGDEF)-like protein